jgi:hypothetical protein
MVEPLDERVAQAQAPLLYGQPAAWRDLTELRLGDLEDKYLRGFAEYLLAVNLETFKRDLGGAAGRYEAAYGALRPFSSPLARTTCSVVEFRMNAFNRLLTLGPESVFWPAANYFQSPAGGVTGGGARKIRTTEFGIWMDSTQDAILDAVGHAHAGDLGKALHVVDRLTRDDLREPGNWTKAVVLRARMTRSLGDVERSAREYRELVGDPVYDVEARRSSGT